MEKRFFPSAPIFIYSFLISTFGVSDSSQKTLSIHRRISRIVVQNICQFDKIKHSDSNDGVSNSMEENVQFLLYNRLVPDGIIVNDPAQLDTSNFSENQSIKFVTHGWMSGGDLEMPQTIKNAYLNETQANIFIVDWKTIATNIIYPCVSSRIDEVAEFYADFLKKLIETFQLEPEDLHLIGHSLGAHISGKVSKILRDNNMKIGRITGLDPALPGFQDSTGLKRLSLTDAELVDVIHTSSGSFGLSEAIGHVDLYPNGGSSPMPGCEFLFKGDACSHSMSWKYFAESISNPFLCTKCDSWESFKNGNCSNEYLVLWDIIIPSGARGTYFYQTAKEAPFSLGNSGVH